MTSSSSDKATERAGKASPSLGEGPASGADAAKVLLAAAERITPDGIWCRTYTAQRPPVKPNDPRENCLAADPKAQWWGVGGAIYAEEPTAGRAACRRAFELLRETICGGSVFLWNSERSRTQADAIAALRECAAIAAGRRAQ